MPASHSFSCLALVSKVRSLASKSNSRWLAVVATYNLLLLLLYGEPEPPPAAGASLFVSTCVDATSVTSSFVADGRCARMFSGLPGLGRCSVMVMLKGEPEIFKRLNSIGLEKLNCSVSVNMGSPVSPSYSNSPVSSSCS